MHDESHIQELLHELLESGRSVEDVCSGSPELLSEVRDRLNRLRAVEGEIDALFPATPLPLADLKLRTQRETELPRIPGYAVEAVLGHGGMGVVYSARHLRLNRQVALKMLLSGVYASVQERERFMREAESVASLRDANIVQIYDVGDFEGRPYFTMEFVEGGSLAQQLAGKPQPAREAAELVATLAGSIEVAHKSGIVHRDLKPSNILLTVDGTPKIADFGLARRVDGRSALTRSGSPIGTPSYMAPEQAAGKSSVIGPSTDVYSLGAILYEMLTGRPPFRAESAIETERQVITEEPVAPSRLNARVPRDLETICLKCLHKDPSRRYSSAAALADDLQRFLRGEPIVARPVGILERIAKWVRRRPARASILIGSALIILFTAGFLLRASGQRAILLRATRDDLAESNAALRRSHWTEARTAIERAKVRLGHGGPAALRSEVDAVDRGLELIAQLEAVRIVRSTALQRGLNNQVADESYQRAFQQAQLGAPGEDPDLVAARIRESPVRDALVTSLDDWALCAHEKESLAWILTVARLADPDPAWRDQVRQAEQTQDGATLKKLADEAATSREPVSVLLLLSRRLRLAGIDPAPLLRRAQFAHPADFWVNFELGAALDEKADPSAIGCYLAALAIRPDSIPVLVNLGTALATQDRYEESYEYFERALHVDPNSALAHLNYAVALRSAEVLDKSIEHARETIRLDPTLATAHALLGNSLWKSGRYSEARDSTQRALELAPKESRLHANATWVLQDCNRRLALEQRLPAVLAGSDKPADAAEAAQFAMLCKERREFAAATRLFTEAFAASPQLAEDLISGNRMNAAYSAAQLGRVDVDDGTGLDAEARSIWRARARAWIRDDIEHWTQLLQNCDLPTRAGIRRRVVHIREEACLDGFRVAKELEKLPAEERAECAALWRDLDALQFRIDQQK